ncbi:MAG: hypothetical protein FWB93_02355 [Oscillospiraceae bacterium]|nr:hypothetical protein [Oscillospiraceae bacterium]
MKKHTSIVEEKILQEFPCWRGVNLLNHVQNSFNIEMALGFAALYCPEIIEVDGCVLISRFYNGDIERLRELYTDTQKIEKWVNTWSIGALIKYEDELGKDILYDVFGECLKHFWQLRANQLFPDKNIVVELGMELLGERGLAITMYQA